jgi:glycosyltransferase involved in cell wall biosynthesis
LNGKADLRISIITAVYNSAATIADCVQSVQRQTCEVEHIVVDGCSTDSTLEIVRRHAPSARVLSERDNGIYDALNKGIGMATGDVIGFLHADDIYADDKVIERVAQRLAEKSADSCYGDLLYVHRRDTGKIIRYWRSGAYCEGLFEKGWMPPHPTFFVKKEIYERLGAFSRDFRIAADYELMLRFLVKHRISTTYIPDVLIKMRVGGASNRSLRNLFIKTSEDYKAWSSNGLPSKWYTIPFKNLSKIPQFFSFGNKA